MDGIKDMVTKERHCDESTSWERIAIAFGINTMTPHPVKIVLHDFIRGLHQLNVGDPASRKGAGCEFVTSKWVTP